MSEVERLRATDGPQGLKPPSYGSGFGTTKVKIIYLTKYNGHDTFLFMDGNSHFLLGLPADADALTAFRKSFLIEDSNFRIGTLSSADFFFFSIGAIQ